MYDLILRGARLGEVALSEKGLVAVGEEGFRLVGLTAEGYTDPVD